MRDGMAGVLPYVAEDAHWQPHSARGRHYRSTSDYREELERFTAAGERVEASATGLWSHGDIVAVRGWLRIRRRGDVVEDTRTEARRRRGGHAHGGAATS